MTESGYNVANWLHEKKGNVLVAVAYFVLALSIIIVAGVSFQQPEEQEKPAPRVTTDYDFPLRR